MAYGDFLLSDLECNHMADYFWALYELPRIAYKERNQAGLYDYTYGKFVANYRSCFNSHSLYEESVLFLFFV